MTLKPSKPRKVRALSFCLAFHKAKGGDGEHTPKAGTEDIPALGGVAFTSWPSSLLLELDTPHA